MYFFYLVFTFLLIYYPPILGINSIILTGIVSWSIIFLNYKSIVKYMNINKIFSLYLFFVGIYTYLFFVIELNNAPKASINFIYYLLFFIFPGCLILTLFFKKCKFDVNEVLSFLVHVGLIQAFLAIASFLIPNVQMYFVDSLLNYGFNDVFAQLIENRMFGYSSNLTYATPVVQSILTIFAVYLGTAYKTRYYFFAIFLAFSGIINARTSIIILSMGLLLMFVFSSFNKNSILRKILSIVLLASSILIFLLVFSRMEGSTKDWIDQGLLEITNFFKGEDVGYFTYMTNKQRYLLPENSGLIFGEGIRVMGGYNKIGYFSDIGFINDIWLGGLVYLLLIYGFYFHLLFEIFKGKVTNKFISLFFFGIFIVANIKGFVFITNDIITVFYILYFYLVILKKNDMEKFDEEKITISNYSSI